MNFYVNKALKFDIALILIMCYMEIAIKYSNSFFFFKLMLHAPEFN